MPESNTSPVIELTLSIPPVSHYGIQETMVMPEGWTLLGCVKILEHRAHMKCVFKDADWNHREWSVNVCE